MNIVQETTATQTIRIVPRNYPNTIDYTLTNEENKEVVSVNALVVSQNLGYLLIQGVFDLEEDNYYMLKVFNSVNNETIFRGKLFCTNQDVREYTINKDEYIFDDTYDNEYLSHDSSNVQEPNTMTITDIILI